MATTTAHTERDLAAALSERLHGEVITAADAGYDEARKVYNAMIDKRRRSRGAWTPAM